MDILLATTMRPHLRNQKIHLIAAIHYPNRIQPKDNNTFLAQNTVHNFKHFIDFKIMFLRATIICVYFLIFMRQRIDISQCAVIA